MRTGARCGLILALLLGMASIALADPEGSHPLVDRPFPSPSGSPLEPPLGLLVWGASDGKSLKLLGEAKLKELVSERPSLHLYSLQVTSGKAGLGPVAPDGLIRTGHVPSEYLRRLQTTHTPFIVTVDLNGRVHRLSYVDHWPLLSAVDARFGPIPAPPEPWWQRLRHWLLRD